MPKTQEMTINSTFGHKPKRPSRAFLFDNSNTNLFSRLDNLSFNLTFQISSNQFLACNYATPTFLGSWLAKGVLANSYSPISDWDHKNKIWLEFLSLKPSAIYSLITLHNIYTILTHGDMIPV